MVNRMQNMINYFTFEGLPFSQGIYNANFSFQIGLVEKEWLDTLPTINPEQITFIDYVEAGQKLASQLKKEVNIS